MRTASSSMARKTGSSCPGDELMTRKTSVVAFCCSSASFSSRLSRATSVSLPDRDELAGAPAFAASGCFGFGVFGRRPLIGSPPVLDRFFIASPGRLSGIVAGQRPRAEVSCSCASNRSLRRQLLQQRLRLFQIARLEPLSELPVNRSQQFARLLHLALVAPEAR